MKKHIKWLTLAMSILMMLAATATPLLSLSAFATSTTMGSSGVAYTPPNITSHEGGYETNGRTLVTHVYDFSVPRLSYYATDTAIAMDNRAAGVVENGTLTTKDGMSMSFGSAVCLGDDYGLEQGYMSFDLSLKAGQVTLGVRTSRTACATDRRGVWFVFDASNQMKIYEPLSGLETVVDFPYDLSEAKNFAVHDAGNTITLSCGETTVAIVKYDANGYLGFCDAQGKVLAETNESDVYVTGYCQLSLADIDGYVDNIVFTNVEVDQTNPTSEELRQIDYSTWTATDAIDRTIADASATEGVKDNRYVGVFYFLCWVGAGIHVQDNTQLYLDGGLDAVWDRFNNHEGGEAYWAEPYFGYYRNTDTWVYRKHAYMLEEAGVDFIYLDVSNAEVFISGHMALFDTWLQMRQEGIDTPQIVFFNGDTPTTFQSNMRTLLTTVYSEENWEKYQELFFMWEGKPLVFGNQSGLAGNTKTTVLEKFTVRGSWAWVDKDNYWSWLQEYVHKGNTNARLEAGGWGRNAEGKRESLSVALGHHAPTSKGRSYVNRKQANNGLGDFEFSSIERAGLGLCFESQFNAVMNLLERHVPQEDPFVLMITGWNEWIAGCSYRDNNEGFCNTQTKFYYVDNFNAEFSRDAEPMRNKDGYGFGDNYYYQMVDYIRKFKGIAATPVADNQTTVSIYDLSTWDKINQTYMDSLYDVELRNTVCYDADNRYINNTGRNDFEYAKVSQDDNNLYFLVKCADDIMIDDGSNWMNLYINTDGKHETGWEGYDYVLNRDRDSYVVTVEKFVNNTFESQVVGGAYYALQGAYMTIRLPKNLVGVSGICQNMIFKWADNSVTNGDPMGFMDLGDTAPDNRFGFVYQCDTCTTTSEIPVMFVSGEQTTTPNGVDVSGAAKDWNITVGEKNVDVVFDMESEKSGAYIDNTALTEYFEMAGGTSSSRGQYQKGNGGNMVRMSGYCDLRTWNDVEGAYTFSMDFRMGNDLSNSIYVRGEMPGALRPKNPANFNVDQVFNYFEWDWYRENGGSKMGNSSTAGSGIGILPHDNGVTLVIKRYAPDGLTVASAAVNLPYPEGFSMPSDGWISFSCIDDGETAKFYFDEKLLCTVKLENPGVTYESDGTGQKYFGLCTVITPDNKEVLKVENTRVNSQGSQVALTTRNVTMEFDNIHIAFVEMVASGDKISQALEVTGEVTYTPVDRLVKTLAVGGELPTTDDIYQPVETTPEAQDTTDKTEESGDLVTEPMVDNGGCASVVLPLGMVTMLAVILLPLAKKKED